MTIAVDMGRKATKTNKIDVKVILDKGVYTLVSRNICVLSISVVVNDQR